jgi:RND superfamily putative drug exporter
MSYYLYRLAHFAYRHRRAVLASWLIVLVGVIAVAIGSGGKTSDVFTVPGTESQKAVDELAKKVPALSGGSSSVVIVAPTGKSLTDAADKAAVVQSMAALAKAPQVSAVVDPYTAQLVSADGSTGLATVQYAVSAGEVKTASLDAVDAAMDPVRAAGLQVYYGGGIYPGSVTELSEIPELIGIIIAFIILLITFGAFIAAGLPILGAIIGVATALMGVTAVASVVNVASASTTVALMLGLSCGIDYGLFILFRHRNNLMKGMDVGESLARTAGTAGSSVVFAALTVIIALCGMSVVGIPFLTVMGLAAAGSVLVALLISLTLVPAVLGFAGTRIIRFTRLPILGRRAKRAAEMSALEPEKTAGARWAQFVVRRRVPVAIVGILALGVLALPALGLQLGLPSGASQSKGNTAREAYDATTKGFGVGWNGPLIIVADVSKAASADAGAQLVGRIVAEPNVANALVALTQNDTTIIQVIPKTGPNDTATADLVSTLRSDRSTIEGDSGITYLVGGTTASNIDVSSRLSSALPTFLIVVVGLAFILLTMAFRTILVPIKSILGFLLSVAAAFGAQVAVFQWGWGASLFGVTPTETVSFLPMIMLAIIFGLSSDYEVFVVSRIKEEFTRSGDARGAVQRGAGGAARVVTAAALIMFSIFVAFISTPDPTVKAIGFSFAVGVALDAFVVRLTIVPAVMAIIGGRLWYHPKWFARYVPDPDIEGDRLEKRLAAQEAEAAPALPAAEPVPAG